MKRGSAVMVSFSSTIDPAVLDHLGPIDLPLLSTIAVRDAAPHRGGPFPAVIFSHGFGGNRLQSVSLTTHLASQGFVVVATDHVGRSIAELVPCMFSPPLDGCALAFDDPAPPDIDALADWLEEPPSWLDVDVSGGLGLMGHSAGGSSTVTVGNTDARFVALAPMAGGDAVTRADVAVQRWAGSCDGIVPETSSADAQAASVVGDYLVLSDAGHLAFSDLCALDLGGLIDELTLRDDVSDIFLDQARQLAIDGCPGAAPVPGLCDAFLPLDDSEPLLEDGLSGFFGAALRGDEAVAIAGDGVVLVNP